MTRKPTSVVTAPAHTSSRSVHEPSAAGIELRDDGVELRRGVDGEGDRVVATRAYATGDTVMIGFLIEASTENDSHATQIGPDRRARHGGLGPIVNHSCDPNCVVRLNDRQAFDFVARRPIHEVLDREVAHRIVKRDFLAGFRLSACAEHPTAASITGWKDLPAARKAEYGDLVAPYLRAMDAQPGAQTTS